MALIPIDRQKQIDSILDDVRLRTGKSYPENNLLEIARELGIKVYEVDFSDHPNVRGVIQYYDEAGKYEPAIFINKNQSATTKTFTLAHELGHYILHKGKRRLRIDKFDYSQNTEESREETEANYFAASLLVPKEKLIRLIRLTSDKQKIADYFGVSMPVIDTRARWIRKNNS